MKKFFCTLGAILSISSFGAGNKNDIQKKIPDLEVKTMIGLGYNFDNPDFAFISTINTNLYKTLYAPKLNTIFNVGVGLELSNIFSKDRYTTNTIIPYFSTEVGGYVGKDVRMYTGLDIGTNFLLMKGSAYLGLSYKGFSTEVAAQVPPFIVSGMGIEVIYIPKVISLSFGYRYSHTFKPQISETVFVKKKVEEKKIVGYCFASEKKCIIHGFEVDGRIPSNEEQEQLKQVTNKINEFVKSGSVDIIGHTDSTGTDEYNDKLSVSRAETVFKLLQESGLNKEIKLNSISGRGEKEPILPNDTVENRYMNRRVELLFNDVILK